MGNDYLRKQWDDLINLTPYKELQQGPESIYEHVQAGYTVPDKVLRYLKSGECAAACPGFFDHPFKPDSTCFGPYIYTDWKYKWDSCTVEYVQEYGLALPEEFIAHVMSEAGDAWLRTYLLSHLPHVIRKAVNESRE